jgi:nitrogen fixation/metabolism regulation signal transduction histidine kinase
MEPAEEYLLTALEADSALLSKFKEVVDLDRNTINTAIGQVYSIYISNPPDKYETIWVQLTILMNAVTQADIKLADVRSTILTNVQSATAEAQSYSNISLIIAVGFLAAISGVSVALSIVMGNRITNPLKKLADIAHKVSLGDLNQRYYLKQNIDIKTGDEIDELVEAFRRMINAFRMTEALSKGGETEDNATK